MVPGSPGYNARIPKPPCYRCGEDHVPGRDYGHDWEPEPRQVHDEPVAAGPSFSRRSGTVVEVQVDTSAQRVALYVGRGDTYVISVEEAPDWDAVTTFRVGPDMVLPLVQLARALRVKIADKTGGDLVMLEEEDARQHAQDNGRGAARPGSGEPRRPGLAAGGPQESGPVGISQETAGTDLGRGVWVEPPGSAGG